MAEGDHLAAGGVVRAKLKRSGFKDYRSNGYTHISGCGRKKKYDGRNDDERKERLEKIQKVLKTRGTDVKGDKTTIKKGSLEHAMRYTFTYGQNFQVGESPYPNQGHHLLPEEALLEKKFSEWQMKVLRAVPYDLNEGTNIIFLPSRQRDSEFHQLPSHQGSHPRYTNQVVEDMEKVQTKLSKVKKEDTKHKKWSPPDDIKAKLKSLENKYWKLLTSGVTCPIDDIPFPALRKPGATKPQTRLAV